MSTVVLTVERKFLIKVALKCIFRAVKKISITVNKGNNKITELRTILQRESQNS